jgi:hypothetical protein
MPTGGIWDVGLFGQMKTTKWNINCPERILHQILSNLRADGELKRPLELTREGRENLVITMVVMYVPVCARRKKNTERCLARKYASGLGFDTSPTYL